MTRSKKPTHADNQEDATRKTRPGRRLISSQPARGPTHRTREVGEPRSNTTAASPAPTGVRVTREISRKRRWIPGLRSTNPTVAESLLLP